MSQVSILRVGAVLTIFTLLLTSISFRANGNPGQGQSQTGKSSSVQEAKFAQLKITSVNIRGAARILKAHGVDFEPGLLFTEMGRRKLRPQLLKFPEMYLSKFQPDSIEGVVMAHTLTLPEKVRITGGTVIIARHVLFKGRAPVIKGPHELHLFALDSIRKENGKETRVTIDTSGLGRKEWLESQRQQAVTTSKEQKPLTNHAVSNFQDHSGTPGTDGAMGLPGTNGDNGTDGSTGPDGSCSTDRNGGSGASGTAGTAAGTGGNGNPGTNGTDGRTLTLTITNPDAGSFTTLTRGGHGGRGGPGGWGGTGGTGGKGGKGGNGASCNCAPGGLGNGGSGGAGGAGGNGGNGGTGGRGGNGGNGANIVINFPFGYDITQIHTDSAGGAGGSGGIGGSAGVAGSAGKPGIGGGGGSVFGCEPAQNGSTGAGAVGGAGANGGNGGDPGQNGTSAGTSYVMTTGPEQTGGGDTFGYEPGMPEQHCTPWYWVSFRCEYYNNSLPRKQKDFLANHPHLRSLFSGGWQCYETGREYIGCF